MNGYEIVLPANWRRVDRDELASFADRAHDVGLADLNASALAATTDGRDLFVLDEVVDGVPIAATLSAGLVRTTAIRGPSFDVDVLRTELATELESWRSTVDARGIAMLVGARDRTLTVAGAALDYRDWFVFVPRDESVCFMAWFTSPVRALFDTFDALFTAIVGTVRFT